MKSKMKISMTKNKMIKMYKKIEMTIKLLISTDQVDLFVTHTCAIGSGYSNAYYRTKQVLTLSIVKSCVRPSFILIILSLDSGKGVGRLGKRLKRRLCVDGRRLQHKPIG